MDTGVNDAAVVAMEDTAVLTQDTEIPDSGASDMLVTPMDAAQPTDTAVRPVADSSLVADSSIVTDSSIIDSGVSDSDVVDSLVNDEDVIDAAPPLECRGPVLKSTLYLRRFRRAHV